MLNNSFKKIISAACVLAMSASLSMPVAFADYYNADQSAIAIGEQLMVKAPDLKMAATTAVQTQTYTFDSSKSGNFTYSFDYTLLGKPVDNPDRSKGGANKSAFIQFYVAGRTASAWTFEQASDGKASFALVNANYGQDYLTIEIGKTYNFRYDVKNAGMGATTKPVYHLTVTDLETEAVVYDKDVDQRNLTDTSNNGSKAGVQGMSFGWCADKTYGVEQEIVEINNMKVNNGAAERTDVTLGDSVITTDATAEVKYDFSKPGIPMYVAPMEGDVDVSASVNMVTTLDGNASFFSYDKESKMLVVDQKITPGVYNFNIDTYIEGIGVETHQVYPVSIEVTEPDTKKLAEEYTKTVTVKNEAGSTISANSKLMSDVVLDSGTGRNAVTWQCYEKNSAGEWVESNKISADGKVTIGEKEAEVKLVATCVNSGDAENAAAKELTFKIASAADYAEAQISKLAPKSMNLDENKEYSAITVTNDKYLVLGDMYLAKKAGNADVEWTFTKNGKADDFVTIVGERGIVTGNADSTAEYVLTAKVSYLGVEQTKDYPLNLDGAAAAFNLDKVAAATDVVSSADDAAVKVNLKGSDALKCDIVLPTVIEKLGNCKISWTSDSENLVNKEGTNIWRVYTGDTDAHPVKLTKKVDYVINGELITSKSFDYNVNVQFTDEDIASEDAKYDKYKARFDSQCASNFAEIEDTYSSSFTLPTKGMFGSTISWQSKNSNVIKINGAKASVTPSASAKKVELEAVFTYNKTTSDDKATVVVTVPGKGNAGGGASGGGSISGGGSAYGGGNSYKGSITGDTGATTILNGTPVVIPEKEFEQTAPETWFRDLDGVEWAKEAIHGMAQRGIVSGKTVELFAPNDNVTRAEFAKMVYGAFDLGNAKKGEKEIGFKDVKSGDWYYDFVMTCAKAGIINGYSDEYFAANDLVTRQDMAVMIARAAEYVGKDIAEVNAAVDFADKADIAEYAADAVAKLQKGGVINGVTATEFAPKANATRAQAAKMLYGFCK